MNTDRCTRRGPKTGAQCCKLANEHEEHHALLSGEKWTDRQVDARRAVLDRRARARQLVDELLDLPAEAVQEALTGNRELAARFDRLLVERAGSRPIVIVESPYAGNVEENVRYARAAVRQCAKAGMVPLASHLLYTQPGILDDNDSAERALGIQLGFEVRRLAAKTLVFTDLGVSAGMMRGIADAERQGCPVEFCRVEGWGEMAPGARGDISFGEAERQRPNWTAEEWLIAGGAIAHNSAALSEARAHEMRVDCEAMARAVEGRS